MSSTGSIRLFLNSTKYFLVLWLALSALGCGKKGPLYLPESTPEAPASRGSAP